MEKIRSAEAMSARDSAVQRLASAYDSIKSKTLLVSKLTVEKTDLEAKLREAVQRVDDAEQRIANANRATRDADQAGTEGLKWREEKEDLMKEIERLHAEMKTLKDDQETLRTKAVEASFNSMQQHVYASTDIGMISPSPTLILDIGGVKESVSMRVSKMTPIDQLLHIVHRRHYKRYRQTRDWAATSFGCRLSPTIYWHSILPINVLYPSTQASGGESSVIA